MNVKMPPLLVVDDEKNMRLSLEAVMVAEGYEFRATDSAENALRLLGQEQFFMVITDARLGGMSGYEFLGAKARWPNLPILSLPPTRHRSWRSKPSRRGDRLSGQTFCSEELLHAVARCAERHRLLLENAALRAQAGETYRLDQLIGQSPKIEDLRQLVQTVAPTNATVLILGESGTGKADRRCAPQRAADVKNRPHQLRGDPRICSKASCSDMKKGLHRRAQAEARTGREADGGTIFWTKSGT